jgi:hypothetical protein
MAEVSRSMAGSGYNLAETADMSDAARKSDSYVESEFGQSLGKVGHSEAGEGWPRMS